MATTALKSKDKEQFGDFQTPLALARKAVKRLATLCESPNCVVEPSCGRGSFALAAAEQFHNVREIVAVEINPNHFLIAEETLSKFLPSKKLSLYNGDFFAVDWLQIIPEDSPELLIIGNPPWVTVSGLGVLGSDNLPEKRNYGLRGIEAMTGKSNFDISEWMIYRYVDWLRSRRGTIAVLCKTSVARRVLLTLWTQGRRLFHADLFEIDAIEHFEASVHACFLVLRFSDANPAPVCKVYSSLDDAHPRETLRLSGDHLAFDRGTLKTVASLRGSDKHYIWRSGIKHDCARVMEFKANGETKVNGFNQSIEIEDGYVYPLLKSSAIANERLEVRTYMLVPQQKTGDETLSIQTTAPKTWNYLTQHAGLLGQRASSIYRSKPSFTVFGVGPYSFAPWKVAISGLYKKLNFVVVGPVCGKPVVFDDTVNFLPAYSEAEANFLKTLLASAEAKEFYESMIHWPDKRPITIEILRRLDLFLLAKHLNLEVDYLRFVRDGLTNHVSQTRFAFS